MIRRIVGLIVGGIAVLALPQSVSAHGGGPESVVSFGGLVNWLHFSATALWLGGIVFLRLVVSPSLDGDGSERRKLMTIVNLRFTHLVWWCIGGLALTGVLTTWLHVPSPQVLTGTTYGLILDAKIAIAIGMVACNAVIGLGLARRSRRTDDILSTSPQARIAWRPESWVGLASRLSLVFAFVMMVLIAALVEFDRSPWSIMLNFIRLSALTVWFGATAFIPLVLSPSRAGVDRSYLVRVNAGILLRFGNLAGACASLAIAATALTLIKNVDSFSDLWQTGYGIVSVLELVSLTTMAIVLWGSGFASGPDFLGWGKPDHPVVLLATSKTMNRAIGISGANLVLGLVALLFSSLGGAVYAPQQTVLSGQIPSAASTLSLDWIEPLGWVLAAVVAAALIWYFGVVEGKASRIESEKK